MGRDYTPEGLVQLPRMNAEGCAAVTTKMVTVGRATKGLRGDARDALDELDEAREELRGALGAKLRKGSGTKEDTQAADVVIDRAWGSLHAWLDGWRGCRHCKEPEAVSALFARIFSDGRTFLLLPYAEEWSASLVRLEVLEGSEARALVRSLGGEPFLRDLREAHDEYGRVLGITVAQAAAPSDDDPAVRAAYEGAQAALRRYVVAVSHTASRMKSGGAEMAARLLKPLNDWEPPVAEAKGGAAAKGNSEKPAPSPT